MFLDYLEEGGGSERRIRGDDHGIYQYYRVEKDGIRALIVLLDVRYERTKESSISEQ